MELLEPGQFRAKILLGLNMYGFSYSSTGGGHILGGQLVELLARHKGASFRYLHIQCTLPTAHFTLHSEQYTLHTSQI